MNLETLESANRTFVFLKHIITLLYAVDPCVLILKLPNVKHSAFLRLILILICTKDPFCISFFEDVMDIDIF